MVGERDATPSATRYLTAGAVFTSKRDISLPAERKLNFKLAQPVEIR
jgi:hypothetical protein